MVTRIPHKTEDFSGDCRPVTALVALVYQGNNLLQEDRRYGADQSVDQDTYQCDRQQHRVELKQGFQQSAKHTLGGTAAAAGIAAGGGGGGIYALLSYFYASS